VTFKHQNKFAAKLSAEQVYTIRQRLAVGESTQIALAQEYRVSIGTIRNIWKGVTHQDIPLVESEDQQQRKIIRSQALLSELLSRPAEAPVQEQEDPLDRILRERGGADPLARLKMDDSTQIEETRNDENSKPGLP
jgi:hypothetical protein